MILNDSIKRYLGSTLGVYGLNLTLFCPVYSRAETLETAPSLTVVLGLALLMHGEASYIVEKL